MMVYLPGSSETPVRVAGPPSGRQPSHAAAPLARFGRLAEPRKGEQVVGLDTVCERRDVTQPGAARPGFHAGLSSGGIVVRAVGLRRRRSRERQKRDSRE